jgi:hypothetical protein
MSSETPNLDEKSLRKAQMNGVIQPGTVDSMRKRFESDLHSAQNKFQLAEEHVKPIQAERANTLKRRAKLSVAGSITLNALCVANSAITGNVIGAIGQVATAVNTATTYRSKQQIAERKSRVLEADHVDAVSILYEKAFPIKQRKEFSDIIKDNYQKKDIKQLLGSIEKMLDPKSPQPLKVQAIQDFLDKSTKGREALEGAVYKAISDEKTERVESRRDFATLYSDPKVRIAVMAKIIGENLQHLQPKTTSKIPFTQIAKAGRTVIKGIPDLQ